MANYSHNADDVTPEMTSSSAPAPNVVSASSQVSDWYGAWRAFKHAVGSDYWLTSGVPTGWIKFDLGAGNASVVSSYTLSNSTVGGNENQAPKTWTLQGSNDDSNWDVLDTQTDAPTWTASEMRTYPFANSTAYRYYKIDITVNQGAAIYLAIGEIELISSSEDISGDLAVTLPVIVAELIEGNLLDATLPIITAEMKSGGALNVTLPLITAEIHGINSLANLDVTLPVITAEITGFVGEIGGITTTLPLITADILGGNGGFLDAILPLITAEMKGGAQLDVTLPMVAAECHGYAGEVGTLAVSLPKINAEITGKVEVLGDLTATLPMILARMKGTVGKVMSLNATLPMITAALTGYQEITGNLNATLPMIEVRITGAVERDTCTVLRYEEPVL